MYDDPFLTDEERAVTGGMSMDAYISNCNHRAEQEMIERLEKKMQEEEISFEKLEDLKERKIKRMQQELRWATNEQLDRIWKILEETDDIPF